MSQGKPNVVFVLGPPGSGKGTQCARIVKTFGYVHLSAGDLLREERNNPSSEFGELIETHIRNGTIVPVEITCSLLENAMKEKQELGNNFFLIDGFPRSQDNLDGWTKQMSAKVNLLFVLFLTCAEEACLARCLGRDEGRSDDNPESLKKRIVTYNNTTMPVIQHYIGLDLVNTVDASADPDAVFETLRPFFESFASKNTAN
jgi:UMP-CMP kinase